jgi:manganese-transporting P-type ATPase
MEAMLVMQRIGTARMLRGMRPAPAPVFAFRSGIWAVVPGETLVPLDIVSLARDAPAAARAGGAAPAGAAAAGGATGSGAVCPADILLFHGTVVANEAMLTGESTPQLKEAMLAGSGGTKEEDDAADDARLNAFAASGDRSHARGVVYAGTLVLAHDAAGGTSSEEGGGRAAGAGAGGSIPPPPDGGCVGVVVRTGA